MNVVLFYHSALSDWNHGNAHFLRGVATELCARGHEVTVYEPRTAWSAVNLLADAGAEALDATRAAYPALRVVRYTEPIAIDEALDGADLVIVHEWNTPALVQQIGRHRQTSGTARYVLLFHDTHHRSVSDAEGMARYDLSRYHGVLAFGEAIRQRYVAQGWAARAFTWHEAADTRVFHPRPRTTESSADVVWIGNWGDDERTEELREFLIEPVRTLGCRGTVHGVRYPEHAIAALAAAGLIYKGWLPNYRVPEVFARHRVAIHVPRRPYVAMLPGIPTIRPFEALACGIPLVSAPWSDVEGLFRAGEDYLVARSGREMVRHLHALLADERLAARVAASGRETILARHTCVHRVNELLDIVARLSGRPGTGELVDEDSAVAAQEVP